MGRRGGRPADAAAAALLLLVVMSTSSASLALLPLPPPSASPAASSRGVRHMAQRALSFVLCMEQTEQLHPATAARAPAGRSELQMAQARWPAPFRKVQVEHDQLPPADAGAAAATADNSAASAILAFLLGRRLTDGRARRGRLDPDATDSPSSSSSAPPAAAASAFASSSARFNAAASSAADPIPSSASLGALSAERPQRRRDIEATRMRERPSR